MSGGRPVSREGHDPDHVGAASGPSLSRTAAVATAHCLTGCAIGEILGLAIGAAVGLSNTVTIVLAILLAFLFGYGLTMMPLLRSGLALAIVLPLALTSDTFSIAVMEIVDNLIMVVLPGAMDAGLGDILFWGSLALALAIAFLAAWPVNRWLIARGRGHAVVHALQHGGHSGPETQAPIIRLGRLAVIGVTAVAFTVGVAWQLLRLRNALVGLGARCLPAGWLRRAGSFVLDRILIEARVRP